MTHKTYQKILSFFQKENAAQKSVLNKWLIGRQLVLEQKRRFWTATEMSVILQLLAEKLSAERPMLTKRPVKAKQLQEYMVFFENFPSLQWIHPELSFSHYRQLLRIKDQKIRHHYLQQARQQHWTTQQLRRQISAKSWQRIRYGFTKNVKNQPSRLPEIKDPYVLEFLKIKTDKKFNENELETAIVQQLPSFLLELGSGYTFVAQQKLLATHSGKKFYIDLVFYNHLQKCFVLIDLKAEPLDHRALGQMDMYLRLFNHYWQQPNDQPTIGIILCPKIDPVFQQFSLLKNNPHLFASTYQLSPSTTTLTNNHSNHAHPHLLRHLQEQPSYQD